MSVAAVAPRMSLSNLVRGRQDRPRRVLVHGVEGVGKSSFAAGAPKPIFLGAEDGTAHLDVARFPQPKTYGDVLDAVRQLHGEHEFKTLVIDSLDWLEPLIWSHVCARDSKPNIEEYGFGKGYQVALDVWRSFLSELDELRRRGMHIVLIAHSWIKTFKNPEGDDFDRYELKLHAKAAGLVKEWCDDVLFAAFETFAKKDKNALKAKGLGGSARVLYTHRTAAYDAKVRGHVPDRLPLGWAHLMDALAASAAKSKQLIDEINALIEAATPETAGLGRVGLGRAEGDLAKLEQLKNWLTAKVAETEQSNPQ